MQRNLGFILVLSLIYAYTVGANPDSQQLPGSFKVAIARRANDGTVLFDATHAKSVARVPALTPNTAERADDLSWVTAVPNKSNDSRTARWSLQAHSEDFTLGNVSLHYGSIRIGTPPQELLLDVATAVGELLVRANCTSCSKDLKLFNKTASTTYKDMGSNYTIQVTNMTATLSEDVVSVQGLSIEKQAFGIISRPLAPLDPNVNGLIGLGFKSVTQQPTFVANLIREKRLAEPIVSVHLARPGQTTDSEACFGCFDDKKATGNCSWVPRASKDNWEVALSSLSVNNKTVPSPNVNAAIETFNSMIVLPQELAKQFYAMIPGARRAGTDFEEGYFEYPCNTSISISITLGPKGLKFPMNTTDFNLGRTSADKSYCRGGIAYRVGLPPNTAVIGDVFLRSWYLTLDYGNAKIGFAPSINNK